VKSDKGLAKHVEALLMGYIPGVDEAVRNVLGEDGEVLVIRTEIAASLVLSLINLDNGLGAGVPVVVGVDLLGLAQLGVVFYDVLFCQVPFVVLVYGVPVVLPDELPGKPRHRLCASPHSIKNIEFIHKYQKSNHSEVVMLLYRYVCLDHHLQLLLRLVKPFLHQGFVFQNPIAIVLVASSSGLLCHTIQKEKGQQSCNRAKYDC